VLYQKKFIAKEVKKSGLKNVVQQYILEQIDFVKMLSNIFIFALTLSFSNAGWGSSNDPGKVLLRDVQVLTLKAGQMTTGRRSSPVPQLKCIGGSAQGHFNPQAVQCYNRGFDGQDVQWECKADMDNLYRFGSVEVVCEGYDYPDDPYILKGSCGLEYTLELTKEGQQQKNQGGSGGYSSSYSSYGNYNTKTSNSTSGLGDLIVLGVICLVVYAMYKTCIDNGQNMGDRQYSSTGSDYPGAPGGGSPGGGGGWFNPGNNTGNNYGNTGGYDDASCGGARRRGTGGGGGFWTGMATGGLMGYMFGNRGGGYGYGNRGYGYNRPSYGGWGTGGGYSTGGSFGGFSGGGSASSGTRSASGYGSTRRR